MAAASAVLLFSLLISPAYVTLTSVSSNLALPMASPSAMARYDSNVGCPTMDDNVSRC